MGQSKHRAVGAATKARPIDPTVAEEARAVRRQRKKPRRVGPGGGSFLHPATEPTAIPNHMAVGFFPAAHRPFGQKVAARGAP
eukprot:6170824-Alexandrium_andersonii.AAC.1